jgi:hypothetical protein
VASASDRIFLRYRRPPFHAGLRRLQQGETKLPLGASKLLSLRRQRRHPAIGRIDDQGRARAGPLEGHEHIVIGARDVALGPALRLSRPSTSDRALSNAARSASVKNSWFAYLAGRCKGVVVSSVQIPCRSGSPQVVFNDGAGAGVAPKQRMRSQVEALAQRGAPSVTNLLKHDGPVGFADERRSVPMIVAKEAAVVGWQQFDALAAFCWLHRAALIDSLDRRIEAEADDKAALSHEKRQQQEAEVQNNLLAVEREENSLVWMAQAQGLPVEHRADCSPLAILQLQLVTTPRALPAASAPLHAFDIVSPG